MNLKDPKIQKILLGVMTLVLAVPLAMAAMHQLNACLLLGCLVWLLHDLADVRTAERPVLEPMPSRHAPDAVHHGTLQAGHPAEGTV